MIPSREACLSRLGACISDLSRNGIHLLDATDQKRFKLVTEHIDYFQLMLGYDSDPGEILELLRDRVATN
jgi:hypothetical protein